MKKSNVVEVLESLDKDKRFQQKLAARREPRIDPIGWARTMLKSLGYGHTRLVVENSLKAKPADLFYRNALAYLAKNELKLRTRA